MSRYLPLGFAIVAVVFVVITAGCGRIADLAPDTNSLERRGPDPNSPASPYDLQPFGNPSNATEDEANQQNFLIYGNVSTVSYNNARGTANWIAWKTTREDLGPALPRPDFRPDPRLPDAFNTITPTDYSGSGYDRGHLVPSADRFGDRALNEETYMMTNIVPQTEALNQYPWQKLEQYVRGQVKRGFDAYQIAGAYGTAGTLKGRITIPTNCWKVIVFIPSGRMPEEIDERIRVVAVDMPNIEGIENDRWEKYRTPVRAIEERTGYDLFAHLARGLQDTIETRVEIVNRRR